MNQRSRTKSGQFDYQNLEARKLLAGISFSNGVLRVDGGNFADVASVTNQPGGMILAELEANGVTIPSQTFAASAVNQILLYGYAGDDTLDNSTSIPSIVNGHAGNDTLRGGFGNDGIYGKAGDDVLIGRGGDDVLSGEDGNDRIEGYNGNDFILSLIHI